MELAISTSQRKVLVLGGVAAAATFGIMVARRRLQKNAATNYASGSIDTPAPIVDVEKARPVTPAQAGDITQHAPAKNESIVSTASESKSCSETNITWDTLAKWSSSLRRKDAAQLSTLLEWTERLLKEQPTHPALSSCLVGLQNLVCPGHEAADRVVTTAMLASRQELDKSLDILNLLFKDPKHRGITATPDVVHLALETLRNGMSGSVQRGSIQRAARLVNFLTEDACSRDILMGRGGASVILEAMGHFKNDPGVLVAGCSSIQSLASEPNLDVGKAVEVNIACCRDHITVGDIQWRALAALHRLPHWSESDAALIVADLACKAAERHPHFDTVVEWVAKVLHRLAKSRTNGIRDRFREPTYKTWLTKFRQESYHIRKPNKEADHWVNELSTLCGK